MTSGSPASPDRPYFRADDLAAELIEEGGARFVEVIDPDTGDGYRFYEVEYALACAMDGQRDVAGIARWASEELGITPSTSEVAQVVSTLASLGYLGQASSTSAMAPAVAAIAAAAPDVGAAARAAVTPPAEDELVAGIVVGAPAGKPAPSGAHFDLGTPGVVAPAAAAAPPAPTGADFELGAPGTVGPSAPAPASTGLDDDFLGAPGAAPKRPAAAAARPSAPAVAAKAPDPVAAKPAAAAAVPTDLAVNVGLDDVKEAVRASRVMKAVDLPPDIAAVLGEEEPATVVSRPPTEDVVTLPPKAAAPVAVAAPPVVAPIAAPTPAPVVAPAAAAAPVVAPKAPASPPATKAPVSLPEAPAAATPKVATPLPAPAAEPAAPRTSRALLVVLVLVLLAGIGFVVWKFVLQKSDGEAKAPTPPPTRPVPSTGSAGSAGSATSSVKPPAPAPAPIVATLAAAPAPTVQVTAAIAGAVASTVDDGATVEAAGELLRLAGGDALAPKLGALKLDIETRVPGEIAGHEKNRDAAKAKGQEAQAAAFEAKAAERRNRLEEKKAELQALTAELEKFVVRAPASGKVTLATGKGKRVAAGDVLATLAPPELLQATFTLPAGKAAPAVGAPVKVKAKGAAEAVECVAATVDGSKVTVTCPSTLAAGTEISLA